jgi:hypothetical protein
MQSFTAYSNPPFRADGWYTPELELTAEPLVFSYDIEKLTLLDISNCMESATGFELRDLVSRLEKAERNIKDGFAKAANAQVANVSLPVVPINGRMLLKI